MAPLAEAARAYRALSWWERVRLRVALHPWRTAAVALAGLAAAGAGLLAVLG